VPPSSFTRMTKRAASTGVEPETLKSAGLQLSTMRR
jgi:hypothetical protein